MQINKRTLIIIGVIILIIVIVAIFLFWDFDLSGNRLLTDNVNISNSNNLSGDNLNRLGNGNNNNDSFDVDLEEREYREGNIGLLSLAAMFAERFGSYSADTYQFANLRELRPVMTETMQKWVDRKVQAEINDPSLAPAEYYGIETRAVSTKVSFFDEIGGNAEVIVSCQREETKGSEVEIKYQDLKLQLIRPYDEWLVQSAEWQ